MKLRVLFSVLAVLTASLPAAAHAAPPVLELSKQETADLQIVNAAVEDLNRSGRAGLDRRLPALAGVLDRAPKAYPLVDIGKDLIIVRVLEPDVATSIALSVGMTTGVKSVTNGPNTYGLAAWLLGWAALEDKDPERAIGYFERGLALQPDNTELLAEMGVARTMQRRWTDSLAAYETALALPAYMMDEPRRALLLRGKGFALIELNRLDEAEAAYKLSLEYEPEHGGALHELRYIADLRKGRSRIAPGVTTAGESKAYGKDAPKD